MQKTHWPHSDLLGVSCHFREFLDYSGSRCIFWPCLSAVNKHYFSLIHLHIKHPFTQTELLACPYLRDALPDHAIYNKKILLYVWAINQIPHCWWICCPKVCICTSVTTDKLYSTNNAHALCCAELTLQRNYSRVNRWRRLKTCIWTQHLSEPPSLPCLYPTTARSGRDERSPGTQQYSCCFR